MQRAAAVELYLTTSNFNTYRSGSQEIVESGWKKMKYTNCSLVTILTKIAKKQQQTFSSNQDFQWNLPNSQCILHTTVKLEKSLFEAAWKIQAKFGQNQLLTLNQLQLPKSKNGMPRIIKCWFNFLRSIENQLLRIFSPSNR